MSNLSHHKQTATDMRSIAQRVMTAFFLLSLSFARGYAFRPTLTNLYAVRSLLCQKRASSSKADRHWNKQSCRSHQSGVVLHNSEGQSDQATTNNINNGDQEAPKVPLLRSEGIFAVYKPLDWTSSDVVSFIRKILERDARERGAKPVRPGSRKNKSRIIKVGHGGTLDPLATGVLVIGVGKGTKLMQE